MSSNLNDDAAYFSMEPTYIIRPWSRPVRPSRWVQDVAFVSVLAALAVFFNFVLG